MILPNVRASFGRAEANLIIGLLTRDDGEARLREEERIRTAGFDALLDDPRTLNVLLAGPGISSAPAPLVFYLLVRHMLLESGFSDRTVADYLAALLIDFGRGNRAYTVQDHDEGQHFYLADLLSEAGTADARRAFFVKAHLGDFALWQSGLFPDRIAARVERRGAPGMNYYEQLGATGYRLAAGTEHAEKHGLDRLYRTCADAFPELRVALNRLSDRYLFPMFGDPVDRVLRQVADGMRARFKDN
jgi:hypothetical protein